MKITKKFISNIYIYTVLFIVNMCLIDYELFGIHLRSWVYWVSTLVLMVCYLFVDRNSKARRKLKKQNWLIVLIAFGIVVWDFIGARSSIQISLTVFIFLLSYYTFRDNIKIEKKHLRLISLSYSIVSFFMILQWCFVIEPPVGFGMIDEVSSSTNSWLAIGLAINYILYCKDDNTTKEKIWYAINAMLLAFLIQIYINPGAIFLGFISILGIALSSKPNAELLKSIFELVFLYVLTFCNIPLIALRLKGEQNPWMNFMSINIYIELVIFVFALLAIWMLKKYELHEAVLVPRTTKGLRVLSAFMIFVWGYREYFNISGTNIFPKDIALNINAFFSNYGIRQWDIITILGNCYGLVGFVISVLIMIYFVVIFMTYKENRIRENSSSYVIGFLFILQSLNSMQSILTFPLYGIFLIEFMNGYKKHRVNG